MVSNAVSDFKTLPSQIPRYCCPNAQTSEQLRVMIGYMILLTEICMHSNNTWSVQVKDMQIDQLFGV